MKARLASALLFVLLQLPVWRCGLFVADEGWTVHIADRIAHGEVLYRDVHSYLPPLVYWVLALPMRLGPSLLWGRLLALLMCAGFGYLAGAIVQTRGKAAQALALGGLAFLGSVGYPSYSIPSYTGLSLVMGLLAWHLWDRAKLPLLAGASLGAALLFKQTTGAALCASIVAAELLSHRLARSRVVVGFLGTLVVAASILALQGGFVPMLHALSPATLGQYSAMGRVPMPGWSALCHPRLAYTLPFLVDLAPRSIGGGPGWLLSRMLVLLLYWVPLPLSVIALLVLREARERALAILAALVFLTLLPRADFAHLAQVLPPVALLLAGLLGRRPSLAWPLAAVVLAPCIVLQATRSLRSTVPLALARDGGLCVFPSQAGAADVVRALREHPGEPMLAAPWGALYYFLAARPNPTRYELLLPGNLGRADMDEALADLRAHPPTDVVWSTVDLRNLTPVTFEQFFPDLLAWRDRGYVRVLQRDGEELWRPAPR